ncbi:hypothetical protein [Armatimonas sp.]|uniref:hypothetical protein n=1 Tax=Armatimonas sp. TaxID=1872638 RepID=UPI00286AC7A4|nr:hypothetical protein [Armatimonas sp.]
MKRYDGISPLSWILSAGMGTLLLFLGLTWYVYFLRCFCILGSFTFTDWDDFVPLALLLLGIGLALNTARVPTWFPRLVLGICALAPALPHIPLYFMAREAQIFLGHWPQMMVNDPKWLVGRSPGYDLWNHRVAYVEAYSGALFLVFWALFFALWSRLNIWQRTAYLLLFLAAHLVLQCDPGGLYAWWLD